MPKITFLNPATVTVEVPAGTSILEAAEECGAHVGSACGGNLACSTCHVWVLEGFDSLGDIKEAEDDIMDKAFDVREESRLGCQARCSDADVIVEVTPESLQAWLDEHPGERKRAG
jgi:ferredoxin, 2Fe-2S